jgi:hypothetical protein
MTTKKINTKTITNTLSNLNSNKYFQVDIKPIMANSGNKN